MPKKVKSNCLEIKILKHLVQYNYFLHNFLSVLQKCINGGSNDHGLKIIFEVKIVFTCKFSVAAFKIYPQKIYQNIEKNGQKVPTVPKTVLKVARCCCTGYCPNLLIKLLLSYKLAPDGRCFPVARSVTLSTLFKSG